MGKCKHIFSSQVNENVCPKSSISSVHYCILFLLDLTCMGMQYDCDNACPDLKCVRESFILEKTQCQSKDWIKEEVDANGYFL